MRFSKRYQLVFVSSAERVFKFETGGVDGDVEANGGRLGIFSECYNSVMSSRTRTTCERNGSVACSETQHVGREVNGRLIARR